MQSYESILITGGTGTFGHAVIKLILSNNPKIKRLVIFSRDELKQSEMARLFPAEDYPMIRFFIGDLRDKERVQRVVENTSVVIHAAAMKQVPIAEYNPFECIKTNVIGAQNLIEACLDSNVKKVIALSTDKAAAPVNLYGASKLCSDKLFSAANNFKGNRNIDFGVVRYGNVFASRGSVVPLFLEQKKKGTLEITNRKMTRFSITVEHGARFVLDAVNSVSVGEIFVPKIPSYNIVDLANAIAQDAKLKIVGLRPGEKLHEEMITTSDSFQTVEFDKSYVILPSSFSEDEISDYCEQKGANPVRRGFSYRSDTNNDFLSVKQLRDMIASINLET